MTPEEFFYAEAGYSYDPKTETAEDGRRRVARDLAGAERWARDNHVEYRWEDDWAIDHEAEFPEAYADGGPVTCETSLLLGTCSYCGNQSVWESLGCVDDATPEYRRVIEAELALQAMGRNR